ncbi:helix-turn-helix domain-containing protein [Lactococcus garvieae]|uniref:Helix-turn-helix transcriptional regulator n=1 Tax=Lactococcus garvieae TaxID=1363 RepID=A0AA43PD80_9LACT|nr:helix-turn-helix transcriptional regulator [Lactococcus garvieae]MDH7959432.1 helix-turn-helix transcriptional regulator [Lactococcus garvieae]BDM76556.1 transcriptional regulator [Lactococcus garvieae]BDW51824.1 transcriptional regulator [Lactococcus garvieae]
MHKNRLKEIRLEKGLTQKQLAQSLEVSPQMVLSWEKGLRNPKESTLEKIANALDVPVDYLTGKIYQIDLTVYEPSEDDIRAVKELIDNYFKKRKK